MSAAASVEFEHLSQYSDFSNNNSSGVATKDENNGTKKNKKMRARNDNNKHSPDINNNSKKFKSNDNDESFSPYGSIPLIGNNNNSNGFNEYGTNAFEDKLNMTKDINDKFNVMDKKDNVFHATR